MTPVSPNPSAHVARPARPAVNVTLQIDEEPEHQPPTIPLTIAFVLSFVPILGLLGAGLAGFDLWSAARKKLPSHGLAYAAIAIQLLYTILGLTLYLVVFQLPFTDRGSLNDPAVQVGQKFLQAVRTGDKEQVASLTDTSYTASFVTAVDGYRPSIQYNPQSVSAETIQVARYQDSGLTAYNGQPASLQIWRVSSNQNTTHYFILTVARNARAEWRVIGVLGLDASGDQTARTIARQVRNNTFGQ